MSVSISVTVEGLDRVLAGFDGEQARARRGVERGVYQHALVVGSRSQQIVPVGGPPTSPYDPAPGTLRASYVVLLPRWEGDNCIVELGYGGAAKDYAVRQHEDITYRHKAAQSAKYLERPLLEEAPQLLPRIADAMRSA